jgi:FMN phosphatase YigB (HAD superfamily)
MKYILDFDEVLFNTTALKAKLAELGISEADRGIEVFERIEALDPSFTFSSLVFPGALKFLSEQGPNCIIVSSATSVTPSNNTDLEKQLLYQAEKIKRSGVEALAHTVMVVGTSKKEALQVIKQNLENTGEDMVFMDDREVYVRQAHALGIKSILMDRTCQKDLENEDFPRICCFIEFVTLVDSWS